MKVTRLIPALIAVAMGLISGPVFAFKASDYNWDQFSDDFVMNKDSFKGDWKTSQSWDGFLCNGQLDVKANLAGRVGDINFKLNEDETLTATADLRSIVAGLAGDYVSELSACLPMPFGHNILIDRIDVGAHVTFTDKGANVPPDLHVKIQKTALGKVTYSEWLPGWFQDIITEQLNAGLRMVWSSSLGDRINEYISKQLVKMIPHR